MKLWRPVNWNEVSSQSMSIKQTVTTWSLRIWRRANNLPGPLPIRKVSKKSFLRSRNIFSSQTTLFSSLAPGLKSVINRRHVLSFLAIQQWLNTLINILHSPMYSDIVRVWCWCGNLEPGFLQSPIYFLY